MSQLIALIIAIALGAIVTAIGFVFLGDAFTRNSERGVALQLVSQASQIEMAFTAHRAEQARSAFDTSFDVTLVDATNEDGLVDLGYLKDVVVPPQGDYSLLANAGDVYLVSSGTGANGDVITENVCQEVERLAGRDRAFDVPATALGTIADTGVVANVAGALGSNAYGCYVDVAGSGFAFAYEVE